MTKRKSRKKVQQEFIDHVIKNDPQLKTLSRIKRKGKRFPIRESKELDFHVKAFQQRKRLQQVVRGENVVPQHMVQSARDLVMGMI